jgi:hypothetical protein
MLEWMNQPRLIIFGILVLASTLACRAATRLIYPDTPTTFASSATPIPSMLTLTSTPEASCPTEMASIIQASKNDSYTLSNFPSVDTGGHLDIALVIYPVNGDQISDPITETVPRELRKYQKDFPIQREAWDLFTRLIPLDQRRMVHEYAVVTDGPGQLLAGVEQTSDDPNAWVLAVDIADVPDTKNLVFTLLHEFGHLLTLNASQVPPDLKVFRHPDDDLLYSQEVAACPDYFPGEGCSLPDSYINTFYQRFWANFYAEWQKIDSIDDEEKRQNKLDAFYRKYADQFVDSYAVTSPEEDIAETWTFYLANPKPRGNSIAEQKILFFYEHPELVQLRAQILANLCAANP